MNSKHPQGITLPSNPVSSRWRARLISRTTYGQTFSPFPQLVNRATLRLFLVCLALSVYPASAIGDDADVNTIKRAAEQGDAEAQYRLGDMYRLGERVPEDDVEAVQWYQHGC